MFLRPRILASAMSPFLRPSTHTSTIRAASQAIQAIQATTGCPISRRHYASSRRHYASSRQQNPNRVSIFDWKDWKPAEQRPLRPKDIGALTGVKEDVIDDTCLELSFRGEATNGIIVPKLWLRDACPCDMCVSPSSGQKRFATCQIPSHLSMDSCRVSENGSLEVIWAHDFLRDEKHISTYPLEALHNYVTSRDAYRHNMPSRQIWDRQRFDQGIESRSIQYSEWMAGGPAFVKAFLDLLQWGLVFVHGVPHSESAVKDIAAKIGHLQDTFYGQTWDVKSKPDAENVAYTNEYLGLHQDLMYMDSPPKIQILHCLENSCSGGESLFSDGLRAAYDIKNKDADAWGQLRRRKVNYHYAKNGHLYNGRRSVVGIDKFNGTRIYETRWSPPFQANFWRMGGLGKGSNQAFARWRDAAQMFKDSIEAPQNMLQTRLEPGVVALFDNMRVLHGRNEFDTQSGHRHLKGGYLGNQVVESAFRNLARKGLPTSSSRFTGYYNEEDQFLSLWPGPTEFPPENDFGF